MKDLTTICRLEHPEAGSTAVLCNCRLMCGLSGAALEPEDEPKPAENYKLGEGDDDSHPLDNVDLEEWERSVFGETKEEHRL